ncbi:hypothetical protein RRG08_022050 [Elysia crispata]|uniref:Uncharacterized protein n=1 Tax=Elysia crispata TaxID=231223 RepID=A0AAE1D6E7_9GAST|nr:hypothetical protein RRG08_022050 [Elysia crispata]
MCEDHFRCQSALYRGAKYEAVDNKSLSQPGWTKKHLQRCETSSAPRIKFYCQGTTGLHRDVLDLKSEPHWSGH